MNNETYHAAFNPINYASLQKKSNSMIFSYRKLIDLPPMKLGNEFITRTGDIFFGGLCIDEHLNFNRHVTKTYINNSKSVGVV